MENTIKEKDSTIKKLRTEIKNVKQQNRRLKTKINKMDQVLQELQQKFAIKDEDISILKNINVKVNIVYNALLLHTNLKYLSFLFGFRISYTYNNLIYR